MMCVLDYDNNWGALKERIQVNDILKIDSLSAFGKNAGELNERLRFCESKNVILQVEKSYLHTETYMDIWEIMQREEKIRRNALRRAQIKGIHKALKKKQEGIGAYGRPPVELPSDFEERLRDVILNEKPLELYRTETGLRKSTFYKYARICRDAWEKGE